MGRRRSNVRRWEPHVRLYRHELESAAYRSLSTDARALLIEMRALYTGRENRIHMSVREAMRRIGGVGQRRATGALHELIDRGFVRQIEQGSFNRKVRHASVFCLTDVPLDERDGAVPPKDFMRWHPPAQKNTVADSATDGSQFSYRDTPNDPDKRVRGSRNDYRQSPKSPLNGSQCGYTDKLPGKASAPASEETCWLPAVIP